MEQSQIIFFPIQSITAFSSFVPLTEEEQHEISSSEKKLLLLQGS